MRDNKRRNGAVYEKEDGTYGLGPFHLEGRRIILEKVLELEKKLSKTQDILAVQNLMARYMYLHNAGKNELYKFITINTWQCSVNKSSLIINNSN